MTTSKIDLETLSPEQCRLLAKHCSEYVDAQIEANNALIVKIGQIIGAASTKSASTQADTIQKTLNEWSVFLNSIADQSAIEVRRIIGESPLPTPTMQ